MPWTAAAPERATGVDSRSRWPAYDFAPKLPTWHVALATVLTLGGIAVIILMIVASLLEIGRGIETQSWSQTQGQIASSELITVGIRRRRHHAEISYAYRVDGLDYVSSRVSYGEMAQNAQLVVRKYRAGTALPVFYDPDNPSQAVLETGVPGTMWQYLAFFCALMVGTIFASALCGLTLLSRRP